MDRETLSHYGWIVILVLILAVMLALATPFGNFLAEGFKATYAGFGMTSDNALGIVIPGAETHEPNTIYYYQPYRAEVNGGVIEYVFHKDGAIDAYITPPVEYGGPFGDIAPSGTAIYGEGTVDCDGMIFTINEDGTAITTDNGGTMLTFTLIPTPIHPLYMGMEYGAKDGDDWKYTLGFQTDGSGTYKEYYQGVEDLRDDYQSGTYEYFGEYFTESWYDDSNGQTYVERNAIYPNGLKIISGGWIYEIDCQHLNTEIRNKTDNYTGDTHCKDCGILIEKGMHLTGQAYALYFENNQMLVFTRSEEEIVAGDTYDGMVISEVYTGFETDIYSVGGGKSRAAAYDEATTPWFPHAREIEAVRFDCQIKPVATKAWFFCFQSCETFDLSRLDMSGVADMSFMFSKSALSKIPTMNVSSAKDMRNMFEECYNLTSLSGFNLPSGLVIMDEIFEYCDSIADFSSMIIPSTVEYMDYAFRGCNAMLKAPNMDNATGVYSMHGAFSICKNLKTAPKIPSAEYMGSAFSKCESLTTVPVLPNNLKDANWIFYQCYDVKTYPGNTDGEGNFKNYKIPSGVEDTSYMFYGCKLLTVVPDLDHCTSLEGVSNMFRDCDALINAPKVPNSIVDMSMMFYSCDNLLTAPDLSHCTKLRDMGYAFDYCRKLEVAPIIPYGVTNLKETFEGTGIKTYHGSTDSNGDFSNYIIPNTVTDMYGTFSGTPIVISPVIPESVKDMTCTFDSCRKLTKVTINANPTKYSSCFRVVSVVNALNPCENITMYGSSSMLQTLANTCETGKRIIYNANGDILRQ